MDIKLKIGDVVVMKSGVDAIGDAGSLMPGSLAYKVALLQRIIGPHVAVYEEQRNALILEHGAEDKDNPGSWGIDPDDAKATAAFFTAINEVANVEVEIKGVSMITLDELSRVDVPLDAVNGLFLAIDAGDDSAEEV